MTSPAPLRAESILVEIAPGELLDKISILEIKAARITTPAKLAHVQTELALLCTARDRHLTRSAAANELIEQLKTVNEQLWDIEDAIRVQERDSAFGNRFIELARSVYLTNDRRAAIKRSLNELFCSRIVEEKNYAHYD